MIRQWLGAHRSVFSTGLVGAVIVAIVATVAIVSGGYTAQRLDLGDAAVWVTNESRQVVGRANTAVLELNTVVEAGSARLDLVQQGATVLVVDRSNNSVDILDPATAEVAGSVALPPEAPEVSLVGDRAVIVSNGDVWNLAADRLDTFDSTAEPALSLGTGSLVSIDPAGVLFAFTPATGSLSRVDLLAGDAATGVVEVQAGGPEDGYQLTSVNGTWALFNESTLRLFRVGGDTDLSATVPPGGAVLQSPSAAGDRVLIAHSGGLETVALADGTARSVVTGRSGRPAAPTTDAGCAYAAWGDGALWRDCGGVTTGTGSGATAVLTGLAGDARLAFRRNGTGLVLNDARNGAAWAVQAGNELIDNWAELIDTDQDLKRVLENTDDTPPEFEKVQQPPVAVDDDFGARPGRAVTLPVLLNDLDPNGDVLVIDSVTPVPDRIGQLDLVGDTQQVQLTLAATATGSVSFGYTANDGRGGSASATVTVTIRGEEENAEPVQARTTRTTVKSGGRVTSQVLGDWIDPDGDPVFLTAATVADPDLVNFTPAGTVVFTDAGTGAGTSSIGLAVSDGRATGTGTLAVSVRPSGSVPIVAESFVVLATAGAEVTVSPLEHVRGGSAPLRLSSVPAKQDVTIAPDFDGGSFRFTSGVVGVHEIEYAVTDGQLTATGRIRVNVAPAPDANTVPITVPHTAFVRGQQATLVDVLATDIDPAGGVLLVTGTTNVPVANGLRIEILDQRIIRVTVTRPLDNGSVAFGYRISNGMAEAEGTVTVIEIPPPAQKQAPLAVPDTVSVRVGDAIDIPVLGNDEHPDGDPITLNPALATGLPSAAGLLFASGRTLRYLAPTTTGNFTAVYRVDAPDGQFANAEVRISVREKDPDSNNPPVPKTITARALAGDTVRIPVPLSGIDPDGDSVQLVGQETNPGKGAVSLPSPDAIDYTAGEYSAGTDTFTYSVVDALGARAVGTVRVGISPRLDGARNPVAAPDEVVVRPGSTVAVRVLGNDSDPDGGELTITGVEPGGADGPEGTAVVDEAEISVRAPNREGRFGFIYAIQNDRGGTSSTFLTVVVRKDAPRAWPDARDTHLALSDVLDRSTVDVDVLANVFFADGSSRSLGLAVPAGYSNAAKVTAANLVRVTVAPRSQIIPFEVVNPDDPSIVTFAFIWVPGLDDALPQLRKGAPPLRVTSEATLAIDINKYVVAVDGRRVRLTDRSLVQATHSNGADLAPSDTRLEFTSSDKYYGAASISFEVTDGSQAADASSRTATIVLPIDVTPRDNQPPAFDGAVIDFEPDETKVVDLARLTSYPYPKDQAELSYSVLEPRPDGFTYSLDGQKLTLHASESTLKGVTASITIGVRDGVNVGKAGRIELGVVASSRPLALPAADAVIAPRGENTVVDVLANDGATNPFPAVPLRVVAVRGADGAGVPAGVTITPNADKSRLTVKVSPDAAPTDTNLQYQVADATGDPARFAWGNVRVSVQDKPDPVTNLRVTAFADRRISVSFDAGAANNSAVSGYEISLIDPSTGAVVGTTNCAATSCEVGTPGNGQGDAVRVSVAARNGIGLSTPTVLAEPVWSDVVPPAPTGLAAEPLESGLRLRWNTVAPVGDGTAMRGYVVTVDGVPQSEVSAAGALCNASSCSIDVPGLVNGTEVIYTVSARNDAYPALSTWNSASAKGTPFGPVTAGRVAANTDDLAGAVTVTWDAFDGHGDGPAGYIVQRLSANELPTGDQACSVSSPAPGTLRAPGTGGIVAEQKTVGADATSVTFDQLTADNGRYFFVVWGHNRAGCVPTAVVPASLRPGAPDVTDVGSGMAMDGDTLDLRLDGVSPSAGVDHFNLRAVDGAGNPILNPAFTFPATGWPRAPLGFSFGEVVRFQVQTCTFWGSCGSWSGTYPAAPEASVTFALGGLAYDPGAGVISWTNGPDNGGLPASYVCSVPADPAVAPVVGEANTCTLPVPQPVGTVRLTVTVNGRSHSYAL